jgi:signal transduction histidine kinase
MVAFSASLISLAHQMEQDRRRLGMDLHDQTIGDLSRLARKAASIDASGANLKPAMAELQAEIGHCLTELRRIVDDSLPAVLDLFGFADAVEEMMRRSQSGLASPMQLKLEDFSEGAVDRLPELSRTLVYRIVQEAVNNAVQHSGAAHLAVRMRCCSEILDIVVEDDGRGGVDPHSPRGISHMRSRAALIGGTVSFARGARNQGTRVGLQLPLGADRRILSH